MLSKSRFVLACLLAALASGCAFGTRHVYLSNVSIAAIGSGQPAKKGTVFVPLPKDLRVEKQSVGCVRNGWGMRTAEVVSNGDVLVWVQECVAQGLSNCGYTVVKEGRKEKSSYPASSCDFVVSLTVDKVFCEGYMKYQAEILVAAEVIADGKVVDRRNYKGAASSMNWAATCSGYQETIEAAMKHCLEQMIPDVDTKLQAYARSDGAASCPSCGTRSSVAPQFSAGSVETTSPNRELETRQRHKSPVKRQAQVGFRRDSESLPGDV